MKLKNDLVVLDLEATGTWIEKDKIIEIAMIKITPEGKEYRYLKRVNPTIPIPPIVSQLTGIYDNDVAEAPQFKHIAKEILEFIAECDLCGFNAERYDLPLLEREFRDAGESFRWHNRVVYDVQKIYHLNEKRDLTAAYHFYCQKKLDNAHSAMVDTQATLEILKKQIELYGRQDKAIETLKEFEYKLSSEFFDSERKFRWWNGNLYMMFGKYAKRYSLQEVVKKDRHYLEWVLSSDFSEEVKQLVADALNGRFPAPKQLKQGELFDAFADE